VKLALRIALVALIATGFLYSQAASICANHTDERSDHCCVVCHIGHSLLVAPIAVVAIARPNPPIPWDLGSEQLPAVREPLVVATSSRAPPA
jgi:hypothetical protein